MPVTTKALAELSDLFGEYDELIDEVKAREGASNWLADEAPIDSIFECEVNGENGFQVLQDAEFLDFFAGSFDENGDEVPVSLSVHQVRRLRALCDRFLASQPPQ